MSTLLAERRRGCETPRIFTKPLRELTPATTHGFACIRFAEEVLGLTLLPWQKWLLIHALELRPDGLYRFRTVIVLVARQNGKTLIMIVLALWHIYVRGSRTVIGTAQDLAKAEGAWAEAVDMAQADPDLSEEISSIDQQKGRKSLQLISKEEYRVAAASRRGARGFSGDLILLDELREHQSWDSWAATTKTTLARPKAQVWCFSNAGDALSIVLRYLRALAHQALDWPDGTADESALGDQADFDAWQEDLDEDSLGLFEWSASPSARRNDRDAWAQANPSMNYDDLVANVITERAIAAALRTDPPSVFLVEVLCRWITTAAGGPFYETSWSDTLTGDVRISDSSRRVVALAVSEDRSTAFVARAGFADDLSRVVDIAQFGPVDKVLEWLSEHKARFTVVVLQSGSPAAYLEDRITAAGMTVLPCSGTDLAKATDLAYEMVKAHTVFHWSHPGLDIAAATARVKTLGGGAWTIDAVNSPADATPLIAWIDALWGLEQTVDPEPSAYENNDLMVV